MKSNYPLFACSLLFTLNMFSELCNDQKALVREKECFSPISHCGIAPGGCVLPPNNEISSLQQCKSYTMKNDPGYCGQNALHLAPNSEQKCSELNNVSASVMKTTQQQRSFPCTNPLFRGKASARRSLDNLEDKSRSQAIVNRPSISTNQACTTLYVNQQTS